MLRRSLGPCDDMIGQSYLSRGLISTPPAREDCTSGRQKDNGIARIYVTVDEYREMLHSLEMCKL